MSVGERARRRTQRRRNAMGPIRRLALAFALGVGLGALTSAVAQDAPGGAPNRFAAVVSVEHYDDALGPARGAAADAKHMAAAFGEAGYQVRRFPEATAGDIRRAAFWLAENLAAADEGALGAAYVTSHAAVINNRTYLLGRDADASSAQSLAASGTPADVFVQALSDSDAASVILIDASARHRGVERLGSPRGLAPFDPPARGLVIFDNAPGTAAPGRGAGVSPFASAAAALLASPEPQRAALRAFRRRVYEDSLGWRSPWVSGRLPASATFSARLEPPSLRGEPRAPSRDVLFVTTRRVDAPAPSVSASPDPTAREVVDGARAVVFTSEADDFASRGWARADGVEFLDDDAFRATLRGAAVLVYVHGSGASLRTATEEAAVFSTGVGLGGRTVAFAWPALEERSTVALRRDAAAAERAAGPLADLLSDVRAAGAGEVNIAGYGVGVRAVLSALELLRARRQPLEEGAASQPPPLLHALLIAPDAPAARRVDRLRAAADMATIVTVVTVAAEPGLTMASGPTPSSAPDVVAWTTDARAAGVSFLEIQGDPATPAPRSPELWALLSPAISGFGARPATPLLRDSIATDAPQR